MPEVIIKIFFNLVNGIQVQRHSIVFEHSFNISSVATENVFMVPANKQPLSDAL